jgi:prepilin-type processing-associated H-X9-DG protein
VAVVETLYWVYNGTCPAWGYRAWVHIGIDFPTAINRWYIPTSGVPVVGQLASWAYPGSRHPGGCQILLADGSTRFVSESIENATRLYLSRMADGETLPNY